MTDSFNALTTCCAAVAVNLDTSTAGVLRPTLGMPSYTTAVDLLLSSDTGALESTTERVVFAAASILSTGPGVVGVTLKGGTSGVTIARVFIGHAAASGDAYDFEAAPMQLFKDGAAGGVLSAGGTGLWTGSFTVEPSKNLIVAYEVTTGSVPFQGPGAAGTSYTKAGAEADVVDAGGTWGSTAGYAHGVDLIQRAPTPAANNLTVASTSFTAASVPTTMKALIQVREVDAAVAGTDYTMECSRNGGTTWTAMALTEKFSTPGGLRVVESSDTDVTGQPSGTAPRWRFKTLNNKMVELHDVYFYWN
ncbi:hypothetical protein [Devosia alba]|uniref:hypothetical protein n=1 Tax=Devosia alba TaxID=3152360 RepID=UPI003266242E